jgi:hypothetical protein
MLLGVETDAAGVRDKCFCLGAETDVGKYAAGCIETDAAGRRERGF